MKECSNCAHWDPKHKECGWYTTSMPGYQAAFRPPPDYWCVHYEEMDDAERRAMAAPTPSGG